jgi:hypothetical protein
MEQPWNSMKEHLLLPFARLFPAESPRPVVCWLPPGATSEAGDGMIQLIDIRTLSLVSATISAVIAMSLGVAALYFRKSDHATAWWALGFLLHAVGFQLIFLRGHIPDFLSIPLANALLIAGPVVFFWGIDVYAEGRPRYLLGSVLIGASVVALLAALYAQPDYRVRLVVLSVILLGINTVIGIELLRLSHIAWAQRILTAGVFFASAAAMAVRGLVSILGPLPDSIFVSSASSAIGFIYSFVMPTCIGICFLSMIAKKVQVARNTTISELDAALRKVTTLSGLLPICASCKKIRDEEGHWHQVEHYVRAHSEVDFTHTICPDCATRLYPDVPDEEEETP